MTALAPKTIDPAQAMEMHRHKIGALHQYGNAAKSAPIPSEVKDFGKSARRYHEVWGRQVEQALNGKGHSVADARALDHAFADALQKRGKAESALQGMGSKQIGGK